VPREHWFEELADHLQEAYLRYSFTKGTAVEVDQIITQLRLQPGDYVLDVGCGPGRHSLELGRRGIRCLGIDISERFVELATEIAVTEGLSDLVAFERIDARKLQFSCEFDGVFSLCEGAFGLQGGPATQDPANLRGDQLILSGMARALRNGRRLLLAAFSAYFQVLNLENEPTPFEFDLMTATRHERTEIRNPQGGILEADLWTTCFTPRELWLMAESAGLEPLEIHSVHSGEDWKAESLDLNHAELLLLARRP
jgi:SAM-dependent methyltransferase|tara:strand:- start:8966 stop:9730 length:765 start_codon:yes stop_codon:yes gene_type:complete